MAVRSLFRYRSFALLNIAGISIGLTCAVVISVFIRYESSFDTFHKKADRIFRVVQHTSFPDATAYWNTTAYPLADALRSDFTAFETVSQISGPHLQQIAITSPDGQLTRYEEKGVLFADRYYSQVFDLQWRAGEPQTAFADTYSVILTEQTAQRYFGAEALAASDVIGRIILFENKHALTVTGIVADPPGNVNYPYDLIIPFDFYRILEPNATTNWSGNYQGTTFVVLSDRSQEGNIEDLLASWKRKYLTPEDDERIEYLLQPLTLLHNETLYGSNPGSYTMAQSTLNAAVAIAIFILVIASVNFINLATAQASVRAREVGVRKVLGGSRNELVFQFLIENQLLIFLGLLISIGLSQLALSQLNLLFTEIDLKLSFQLRDVLMLTGACAAITLMATVYPAVTVSSFGPAEALKDKQGGSMLKGQALRKSLIVFQFAIVQFFIISTLIIGSQVRYFLTVEGYPARTVIVVPAPEFQKAGAFRAQLMQGPSISGVAFGSGPPAAIDNTMYGATFRTPQQGENEAQKCEMKIGDLEYVRFFGLELIAGRNFSAIRQGYDEFIVNERLVKAMGWTPDGALGQVLNINGADATVVGVVKDFHNTSMHEEIVPCAIMNWVYFQDLAFIHVETSQSLASALSYVEDTWRDFVPERTYSFRFLDDMIAGNYAVEQLTLNGFAIFSILAIVIGSLGLYGLMSFITLKKTKEVGIRKALGATVRQIVLLFSGEFVVLIAIGFCIVAPATFVLMEQWLSKFAYRISISWWMFAAGGAFALLIALITICYQSITAALANPVDSLRNE